MQVRTSSRLGALILIALFSSIAPAKTQSQADNYLKEATNSGMSRWPKSRLPIPVYIKPGNGVPGYKPVFAEVLKESFNEWQTRTNGLVSFKFVDQPQNDGIICSWTNDKSKLIMSNEGGHAETSMDSLGIIRSEIYLLTLSVSPKAPELTPKFARMVDLHEIGHALGLLGHSPSAQDEMYAVIPTEESDRHLSTRDVNTLLALYKLSDQEVAAHPIDITKGMSGDASSVEVQVVKLNFEATEAYKKSNLPLAISKLQEALKLNPNNEMVMANLGGMYANAASLALMIRNMPQAERYFKLAIPLLEHSPDKTNLINVLTAYSSVLQATGQSAESNAVQKRLDILRK